MQYSTRYWQCNYWMDRVLERRRHMEDMGMTDREQATMLMDKFIDLQRIKNAADRDKEIEYQLRTTRAKLEALKIVTEDLTMD